MTADIAMKVGQAAGTHFLRGSHQHRVVIGKDTRLSGYMLENALTAGLHQRGHGRGAARPDADAGGRDADAIDARRSGRDDLAPATIPIEDNGIKLFGPDGFKLSDEDEAAIEAMMDGEQRAGAPSARHRPGARGSTTRAAAISTRSRRPSRRSAARRAEDRGRLRQWRGLQGGARRRCGNWARK